MQYGAIVVALVGFCLGICFRFKVLLPFLAILLIVTGGFAAFQGYDVIGTALTVVLSQIIIQVSYFAGMLTRWVWNGNHLTRLV